MFFMKLTSKPVNEWLVSNYWKLLTGTFLLEIILLQIVFPNEKIELTFGNNNELFFLYNKKNKQSQTKKIVQKKYWWNYCFGGNQRSGDEGNATSNNSGLGGGGIANGVWLYLKLIDDKGNEILLYEREPNWASTPNWKYSLENTESINEKYKCFHLQKLVTQLSEKDI